ncbi:MAG: hypothetical protein QXJ97_08925 [Desulfurococcaceae archaeon]
MLDHSKLLGLLATTLLVVPAKKGTPGFKLEISGGRVLLLAQTSISPSTLSARKRRP